MDGRLSFSSGWLYTYPVTVSFVTRPCSNRLYTGLVIGWVTACGQVNHIGI